MIKNLLVSGKQSMATATMKSSGREREREIMFLQILCVFFAHLLNSFEFLQRLIQARPNFSFFSIQLSIFHRLDIAFSCEIRMYSRCVKSSIKKSTIELIEMRRNKICIKRCFAHPKINKNFWWFSIGYGIAEKEQQRRFAKIGKSDRRQCIFRLGVRTYGVYVVGMPSIYFVDTLIYFQKEKKKAL